MPPNRNPIEFFKSLGPAIIVAAVVLGPGSIILSSKAGAACGLSAAWVLIAAIILLIGMVRLAAHVGLAYEKSPCEELAERLGKPVSIGIGLVLFLLIAGFQTSNNVAVAAAIEPIFAGDGEIPRWLPIASVIALNIFALLALYFFRSLYKRIELIMKALVLMMVVAFLTNAIAAAPALARSLSGPVLEFPARESHPILLGLVATTFSVAAAFYQAYLVRERGWSLADSSRIRNDSIFGILVLGALSLLIMLTSTAVFYGKPEALTLATATDVARQLEPLFGDWARLIFGLGILAAAFSSFLVNAMIGGTILSDGLGLGAKMGDRWPRHLTALALGIGMAVGTYCLVMDLKPTRIITYAQALTVIGVPALAAALLYLGTRPELSGERKLPRPTLILASIGGLLTLPLAYRTITIVISKLTSA